LGPVRGVIEENTHVMGIDAMETTALMVDTIHDHFISYHMKKIWMDNFEERAEKLADCHKGPSKAL